MRRNHSEITNTPETLPCSSDVASSRESVVVDAITVGISPKDRDHHVSLLHAYGEFCAVFVDLTRLASFIDCSFNCGLAFGLAQPA